jgi:flagellar FliJ protein
MHAHQGLDAAIEQATRVRDGAAQQLALARQAWVSAQMQLDQLQGYAQETDARWSLAAGRTATPEVMQHHYQFMQRLTQAVQLQSATVAGQARRVEERAQALREAETRLGALRQVIEQRQQELLVAERRREQKQVDEIAALQFRKFSRGQWAGGY